MRSLENLRYLERLSNLENCEREGDQIIKMKIVYLGYEVKEVEIFLRNENVDDFDNIYIQTGKEGKLIEVRFVGKHNRERDDDDKEDVDGRGGKVVSSWTLESENDAIYVRILDGYLDLRWMDDTGLLPNGLVDRTHNGKKALVTSYLIPLDKIEFIKADKESLY